MLKRSITGLFLGIIMIGSLLYSSGSAVALFLIILLFSSKEWYQHFTKKVGQFASTFFILVTILLVGSIIILILFENKQASPAYLLKLDLILVLILALFAFSVFSKHELRFSQSWYSGIFYIGLPILIGVVFLLQNFEINKYLILGFIIMNWSNDTFAYLIGRKIGRTALAKSISPNKTIEGTIGGLLATILTAFIINYYLFPHSYSISKTILLGLSIGIAGTVGDLYESKMKRIAGIKDTGNILPGHGGFLDRFDSFFFIVPVGILIILL